jgi:hypothetical protein
MTAEKRERRPGQGAALDNLNTSNTDDSANEVTPQLTTACAALRRRRLWCNEEFDARQTGGTPQTFCWPISRRAFRSARAGVGGSREEGSV